MDVKDINTPGYEIPKEIEGQVAITTLDKIYNWGRSASVWPLMFALACCGIEYICAQADGLIERIDSRKKLGKGRPESVFAVSNVFIEDSLENLIEGILKLWLSTISPDELDRNVQAIARYLAEGGVGAGIIPINKKLTISMSYLIDRHYKAQWEASPSGPRIKFGNCPYRKIINRHPELCIMDRYLLEELVGIKMTQVSKLERDERGKFYCSFIGH